MLALSVFYRELDCKAKVSIEMKNKSTIIFRVRLCKTLFSSSRYRDKLVLATEFQENGMTRDREIGKKKKLKLSSF